MTSYAVPGQNKILGSLLPFVKSPLEFVNEVSQLGDSVAFRLGPYRTHLFRRAEDVNEVLVGKADHFYKDRIAKRSGGKFVVDSLIFNDGGSHRQQRKRMQPAFYHR